MSFRKERYEMKHRIIWRFVAMAGSLARVTLCNLLSADPYTKRRLPITFIENN